MFIINTRELATYALGDSTVFFTIQTFNITQLKLVLHPTVRTFPACIQAKFENKNRRGHVIRAPPTRVSARGLHVVTRRQPTGENEYAWFLLRVLYNHRIADRSQEAHTEPYGAAAISNFFKRLQ